MPGPAIRSLFAPALILFACGAQAFAQAPDGAVETRPMTFLDVMKFRNIQSPVLSGPGTAVAYQSQPDRGDGEVVVYDLAKQREYRIARGQRPVFSDDGRWVAVLIRPPFFAKTEPKPMQGAVLLDLATGEQTAHERVDSVAFSKDGRWVAMRHFKPAKGAKEEAAKKQAGDPKPDTGAPKANKKRDAGTELEFWLLGTDQVLSATKHAVRFAFDPSSANLYYAVAEPTGAANGLYRRSLAAEPERERAVLTRANHVVTAMAWSEEGAGFAVAHAPQDERGDKGDGTVFVVEGDQAKPIATTGATGEQWVMPTSPSLRWSKDGSRLFTGFWHREMADKVRALKEHKRKADERSKARKKLAADVVPDDAFNLYSLIDERKLDIWHIDDPKIITEQKARWSRDSKQTWAAVWHRATGRMTQLADGAVQSVQVPEGSPAGLGADRARYATETTWDGRYEDVYLVDVATGERRLVAERLSSRAATMGPQGRHVLYWREGHWHHFDGKAERHRNLTADIATTFANEDHDYPSDVPSYGTAGWRADGRVVYVYDKFDIWEFAFDEAGDCTTRNLTNGDGRRTSRSFRVVDLDPDDPNVDLSKPHLLSVSHDVKKYRGLCMLVDGKVETVVEEDANYSVLADSEDGKRVLFTRETYRDYPDLWVGNFELGDATKVSDLGAQTEPFAWGTAELVDWQSVDGKPLQGVLIKPDDYEPGKRYPVLVYYYRFFSQRLHDFNQVVVNHRPCFPYYASNGYCVFLPDIRFDIGNPGYAATKCLVPGVQKLIDMGVAKPDGIGLHGHSWSGYQTAFVITQTNRFACAVAGAPVSNMTSAYGGIRWESGMSRQFQYEKTQSRIGGSLWTDLDLYIENSPVFYADRIETPLLIQFGDKDGAVPWTQGIELYMAMRRLQKPCVFLQYRDEPHHLKQYANKLDYSIRMKQWLDHYCLGKPAEQWIRSGEPYRGR